MKKIICLVLSLLLLFSSFAMAEGTLEKGEVKQLALSDAIDLDGDGSADSVSVAFTAEDEDDFLSSFVLTVNGVTAQGECECAAQTLYALRTTDDSVLLLVPEYGPSDDDYCHCFLFEEDRLIDVGGIPSAAEDISVEYEAICCRVRGSALQTWFRPATYVLARSYSYSETEEKPDPVLREAPMASYPVGTIVTLLKDIELRVSPYSDQIAMTLTAGEKAVITASDDVSWVYIEPLTYDEEFDSYYYGGYASIQNALEIETTEGFLDSWDVFDGLCFAD